MPPASARKDKGKARPQSSPAGSFKPGAAPGERPTQRDKQTGLRVPAASAFKDKGSGWAALNARSAQVAQDEKAHLKFKTSSAPSQLRDDGTLFAVPAGISGALSQLPVSAAGVHRIEFELQSVGGGGTSYGMAAPFAEAAQAPGMALHSIGLRRDGRIWRDGAPLPADKAAGGTAWVPALDDRMQMIYTSAGATGVVAWARNGEPLGSLAGVPSSWHFAVGRHDLPAARQGQPNLALKVRQQTRLAAAPTRAARRRTNCPA